MRVQKTMFEGVKSHIWDGQRTSLESERACIGRQYMPFHNSNNLKRMSKCYARDSVSFLSTIFPLAFSISIAVSRQFMRSFPLSAFPTR